MYRPGGSLAEQVVFNRDRSRIISEFNESGGADDWDERHTVITPDGNKVIFENRGDTQTLYAGDGRRLRETAWTDHGAEEQPIVQKAFAPLAAPVIVGGGEAIGIGAGVVLAAGLALFAWLSSRNGPQSTAVLAFKARAYRKVGPDEEPAAVWVGRLTQDQVNKACNQLDDVQRRTDKAVDEIRQEGEYEGPADFGTKVHKRLADGIKALKDDDYTAEVSLAKSKLAANLVESKSTKGPYYGQRDTIRVDVLENRPDVSTVCVYDPKTGKEGLSFPRMTELAQTVQRRYPGTQHIIVIEVRPTRK
jgi:hypothetical protein